MAATNNLQEVEASAAITATGLAALPTSSTLVAGFSLAEVDNTTNKRFDDDLSGVITVGTTPTANTLIEVWLIPKRSDSAYHDTFDGTAKTVTVTARTMLRNYGRCIAAIDVDTATSNRGYEFHASVLSVLGWMPAKYQIFVVHNTGVNLNATGTNFSVVRKGIYSSSGN